MTRRREIAHILTITPDPENDDWDWKITCPYEPDRFSAAGCRCNTVMECDCKLSSQEREDLLDTGEGPCPTSPSGVHEPIPEGIAGHEVNRCWVKVCDFACDVVADIHSGYGVGTFFVAVTGGWEELELEVLARVDEAVAA